MEKDRDVSKVGGRILTSAIVMLTIGVFGFGLIYLWIDNQNLRSQLDEVLAALNAPYADSRQESEGMDQTIVTTPEIDNYKTAPDLPRILTIDKLAIRSRVMQMGVNADNSMQSPININDVGWFMLSAKPSDSGAVVIDGHSGLNSEGVFGKLDSLAVGDTISLEIGKGEVYKYEVRKVVVTPLKDLDMSTLLKTYDGAEQGLNLISCVGNYIAQDKTFDKRVSVFTTRID